MDDNKNEFEYEGFLVFTPIALRKKYHKLNEFPLSDNSDNEQPIIDIRDLPEFNQGNPKNPGKGFERIDLRNYRIPTDVDDSTKPAEVGWEFYKYKSEKFTEEEIYIDDELKTGYVRDVISADIFIMSNKFLLSRGRKSAVNQVINYIQTQKKEIMAENISISPKFLSKLYREPEQILKDTPLKMKNIRVGQFEAEGELSRIDISVGPHDSDIRNLTDEIGNKYPVSLRATFEYFNSNFLIELKNNRIHIRESGGNLSDLSSMAKLIFATELSKVLAWKALEFSTNSGD